MTPTEQFRDALAHRGIVADNIIGDGQLHRADVEGKNGRNDAAYLLHLDGIPAGGFENHKDGCGWETWKANIGRSLTVQEAQAQRQRIDQAQRQRDADLEARRAEARERASVILSQGSPAKGHPYLRRKGIDPARIAAIGIRTRGPALVVPIRDSARKLQSLQFIGEDGRKRFLAGGRITGNYCGLGTPSDTVCIAEGLATGASIYQATGNAVAVAFDCGNLEPVARAMRAKFPTLQLVVCGDDDYQTEGNPGRAKAMEAARAVGGLVALPDFGDDRPEGAKDFNDLARLRGPDAVKQAIASAKTADIPEGQPPGPGTMADDLASRLAALAAMPALEYDRVREDVAAQLGVRVSTLDTEVAKKRADVRSETGAGQALQFAKVEPWPEPVNGAALLAELADSAKRHLVLPKLVEIALALWVVFTYTIDAADTAPILAILSPEKRCGKSTLLDWLTRLVRNALAAANVSPAAMFRALEKWHPTLLIDEADTFLRENEELRGLLNSGHTRSMAFVVRAEGDAHEVKQFSTWGAKAIALIGKLPDTLADRSITIEMRRKMPSERVQKLRGEGERRYLEEVSRRCQRFAIDALPTLKQADPKIPDGLNDRAADSWAPLLAIADHAGGDWPKLARNAASVLCGATPDGDSLKVELLRDVRAVFIKREQDRLPSTELAEALAADHERPWSEYNRGKAMTVRQLARLLNAFGILSDTVRFQDGPILKGYKLEDFADAFSRYLPPFDPLHSYAQAPARVVTNIASVTNDLCNGSLSGLHASTGAACNGVTDENPGLTGMEDIPAGEERF